LTNGVHDEGAETTVELGLAVVFVLGVGPLLGLGVVERITPELLHNLFAGHTELLGVHGSEAIESETPAHETGTETDGTTIRVDLDVTEEFILVGGDDDVDVFNVRTESLVGFFEIHLEFDEGTIELVDEQDRLDTFSESLTQDGFSLDTDTFDTVDDDEGTIGDTESGSDFRGEIDVTGRIDQVDQVGDDGTSFNSLLVHLLVIRARVLVTFFVLFHGEVERDGGSLDGNGTFLFVSTGIHETSITGLGLGDNTGTRDQGVSEG